MALVDAGLPRGAAAGSTESQRPDRLPRRPSRRRRAEPAPPVAALSYSSLGEYERCGYRFYAERVLGLPPVDRAERPRERTGGRRRDWPPTDRGVLVHALLERLDFRRPVQPTSAMIAAAPRAGGTRPRRSATPTPQEIAGLVERFAADRAVRAAGPRHQCPREERFAFLLGGAPAC